MKIKKLSDHKNEMNILLINRGVVFRLANKAQLILKLSFFVSILVLALVFLRKCNHGLQNFLTVVINKSVSKVTQKNGYKFERKKESISANTHMITSEPEQLLYFLNLES